MPFDGTELELPEDHPLSRLGAVERLLATEEQWCKGTLRDSDGRHCLMGAMQAVKARMLEPVTLQAAREVGRKHYWRLELFNNDPRTTHAQVLRVLQRAREHIIVGIIEAEHRAPRKQRFVKALRAVWAGRFADASAALLRGSGGGSALEPLAAPSGEGRPVPREICRALQ
jgi:hypothetical protein